jgi:hypothetical protein
VEPVNTEDAGVSGVLVRYILVVFELIGASVVILFDAGSSFASISLTVMLCALAYLCEIGDARFGRRLDRAHIRGYALLIVPVMLINYVLSEPAPGWFPTGHAAWVLVPVVAFGVASLVRGWMD